MNLTFSNHYGNFVTLSPHRKLGAFIRPDKVFFTAELPKTRSAKIMRRLLRDIAEGKVLGDTTTLADPSVLAQVRHQYAQSES